MCGSAYSPNQPVPVTKTHWLKRQIRQVLACWLRELRAVQLYIKADIRRIMLAVLLVTVDRRRSVVDTAEMVRRVAVKLFTFHLRKNKLYINPDSL